MDSSDLLFVATTDSLLVIEREGSTWREARRGLEGQEVTSVIAREGVILAGTTNGVYRSDDLGSSWYESSHGLTHRHVRWMAYHPEISDLEFVGSEPAGIFVSQDGAASWQGRPEVEALREQHGWYLPYSPEAGCVRGFAFHGERAYAAVEVGGVLRSDDRGGQWRLVGGGRDDSYTEPAPEGSHIHPDVHSVASHPSSPDLVLAASYGGLYRSTDGGEQWSRISGDCYCRAFWLDPHDPDHIILGPATRRGWVGSIEETRDGGQSWQPVIAGSGAPWEDTRVERFVAAGDELLALLDNGTLLAAPFATLVWRQPLPEIGFVHAATTMAA